MSLKISDITKSINEEASGIVENIKESQNNYINSNNLESVNSLANSLMNYSKDYSLNSDLSGKTSFNILNNSISVGNSLVPEDEQEMFSQTEQSTNQQNEEEEEDIAISVKFDPELKLPEIPQFLNNPSPDEDPEQGTDCVMQQTKVTGILTPLVKVGNTPIPLYSINYMELTDNPYPSLYLEIRDMFELVKTFDKPTKDNSVQIQIIPTFDNAYKKINLTFWITNVTFSDSDITINAIYNIPKFHDNVLKAYGEITTYEFFEKIAKDLQLGFASNLESTDDKRWIYIPNKKVYDAMRKESIFGGNERQILDWWIDWWNYLNLVDIYERNNTIDKNITVWATSHKYPEIETGTNIEPIKVEAMITNNDIFRDFQLYVSEYDDIFSSSSITDKIVETYNINEMEEDNFIIRDGDVNNDVFIKYEYGGENFGDYKYIKQKACRDMWVSKVNNSMIKVSLRQPCLSLMKGHKVNFYWYTVNEFTKDLKDNEDVNSNIELPDDNERDEASNLNPSKMENEMIIDKQVSGQYYIVDTKITYQFNSGSFNWSHELTLSRPEDQKEYFDWDSIKIGDNQ